MANIDKHYTKQLIAIDGTAPCRDAARLMLERRVGAVAVRDRGKVVGLISERDMVACALEKVSQCDQPVLKWVKRNLPTVKPSASDFDCSRLMRDHNARHLLVEDQGQVVGIISMRDVIRLMLDEKEYLIDQLQSYITRG
jgi:signal-transduction protein with cAMP-binding, CBS, and nucleotidyltransferase domain